MSPHKVTLYFFEDHLTSCQLDPTNKRHQRLDSLETQGQAHVSDAFIINDVSLKKVGFTACSYVNTGVSWLKYVIFYSNMIISLFGRGKNGYIICRSVKAEFGLSVKSGGTVN